MKVTLISRFKNHQVGETLDVSGRIFNYLVGLGCVRDPQDSLPVEFTPDVIEAAKDLEPKRKSRKEPKNKKEE